MQRDRFAHTLALTLVCAAAAFGIRALAQSAAKGPLLRYAISVSAMSEVNPSDALAATLVYAKAIGQAAGSWNDAEAKLVPDQQEAVRMINSDGADLIAMPSVEFLAVERAIKAAPALAYEAEDGRVGSELVLLVKGDAIRSIGDLKGKRVAYFAASSQRDLAEMWLDVLLMEAGAGDVERALGQIKPFRKRGQAAMALFFGQVDAAIEPRSALNTAVEMNPQLGRDLHVLTQSASLLPVVICLRNSLTPELRKQILLAATELHKQPKYRQTFIMMRATRLVMWEPRLLEGTRALVAKYEALHRPRGR
jgi:ABC-type phosphate/phosphonate transport system substrate-binding protein